MNMVACTEKRMTTAPLPLTRAQKVEIPNFHRSFLFTQVDKCFVFASSLSLLPMYRCRYPPTPEPLFFAKHGLKITILTHFRALFYPYLLSLVHFQPIGPSKTFLALFQKSFISRRIQIFIGICISQHASVFVVMYILPLFATEVWVVRREGCNSIFFDKRT